MPIQPDSLCASVPAHPGTCCDLLLYRDAAKAHRGGGIAGIHRKKNRLAKCLVLESCPLSQTPYLWLDEE